jgi:hypothetical protein
MRYEQGYWWVHRISFDRPPVAIGINPLSWIFGLAIGAWVVCISIGPITIVLGKQFG